ncbi:phospholipase A-2-activating protein [Dendroctonus ponderosae]|uniref:Phospholipase A-2-activating protein n=1 Tax=Dendroctonus ponderosae TaxID=77166 RepID=U4UIQ8_DENPD|nr:phospholipase A-2-activating protein [Dendroctonus ponderosae]ERL89805.1 hypothetical protein D910_07166 [Dendroctonus ponderosae]KAH1014921.1 hypothetical protein HUJ05_012725 [Dendroctonus ponderosae]KAH1014922.1 hypothetical protein HUJ05_012725 [Dendroctonus ponderosae]
MSGKEFTLSRTLYGHSLDVRCIAVTPSNDIISGSRDKTAKFWKYNPHQSNFEEVMTYKDQQNFVACVLYLDPTEEFPDGLVVTGGNDSVILVYKPSEPFSTFTIKEHSNTVCALGKANEANAFLTGSWDTNAKYIKISETPKCIVTFTGHTEAIWGVTQLKDNRIVSASADKTLIVWSSDGQKLQSLSGHTDCVRAVIEAPALNAFLSISNDASIKVWSYGGDLIDTYYGHTSYIYDIAVCKDSQSFVTSDEDRTVRYWENGENTQTIMLPAQSVWSVACLNNGDIVTGSSDGLVRVFTQDKSRYADEAALTKYREEGLALERQSKQEFGGVKVSDLPGKEALYTPGKKAGQMLMIRDEGKVIAYTWFVDGETCFWDKVGEVLGSTDKDSSGKTVFEGKSYDFVFSVDVEEGKPPLKLPYNRGDDVYQVANNFLTKNFLPATYLEQVVDFILKNSSQQYVPPSSSAYQDPFTGGNRYTPSYQNNTGQLGVNVDPFTGGSSYSTRAPNPTTSSVAATAGCTNPPPVDPTRTTGDPNSTIYDFRIIPYKTFDSGVPGVILKKLKEFNSSLTEYRLFGNDLENLVQLCVEPSENATIYELLFKMFEWPENNLFPVLDIVRMAVRNEHSNTIISKLYEGVIIKKLQGFINSEHAVVNNRIVALRTICNLCSHKSGENLVSENIYDIIGNVSTVRHINANGQLALATVLMNLTLMILKNKEHAGYKVLAEVLPDMITTLDDSEAQFRIYVAIGTLMQNSDSLRPEVVEKIKESGEFLPLLKLHFHVTNEAQNKRANCAKQIYSLL